MSIVSKFPKKDKKNNKSDWRENLLILPIILFISIITISIATIGYLNGDDLQEYNVPDVKAEPIQEAITAADIIVSYKNNAAEELEINLEPIITDDDRIAEVLMAEARGEGLLGMAFVAMTILNRCDYYDMSVKEVIESPGQYSNGYVGEISHEAYRAIELAREYRDSFPNIMWFRAGKYHNYGEPAFQWGNHYFSELEREDK